MIALPENVVRDICDEIDLSWYVVVASKNGHAKIERPKLLEFVQAAMEYPHFASTTEIARALHLSKPRVYRCVKTVKDTARKTRTSGR